MLRYSLLLRQAAAASAAGGTTTTSSSGVPINSKLPTEEEFERFLLKQAKVYQGKSLDDLKQMIQKREQEIYLLRSLHEQAHTRVEYHHRRQLLDYEDKALMMGQVAGKMQIDYAVNQRYKLEVLRKEFDMGDRHKGTIRWIFFLSSCWLIWWLQRHYVWIPGDENQVPLTSQTMVMGPNAFISSRWFTARNVETAYDTEVRLKREKEEKKKENDHLMRLEAIRNPEAAAAAKAAMNASEEPFTPTVIGVAPTWPPQGPVPNVVVETKAKK